MGASDNTFYPPCDESRLEPVESRLDSIRDTGAYKSFQNIKDLDKSPISNPVCIGGDLPD